MEPCIFCGLSKERKRTKEHIVPEWLEKFLELEKEHIQPTHMSSTGEIRSMRQHAVGQFLCGGVCNKCNERWMSKLETQNQNLIKKLITDELDVRSILGTKEALHLAKWSCKTAFVLHAASNYRRIIPTEHFKILCGNTGMIPSKVAVFAKNWSCNQKFSWSQSTTWKIIIHKGCDKEGDESVLYKQAYKISLQFGSLLLLVAFNPFKNDQQRLIQLMPNWNIHRPLFPRRGPCSWAKNKIELPRSPSASLIFGAELGLVFMPTNTKRREEMVVEGPGEIHQLDLDAELVSKNSSNFL